MARQTRTPKIRLGELLVAAGLVSDEKVRMGLEEQRRNNLFLGEALVQLGFVTEEAIAQAIIQHFNLPFLSASQFTIPPEVFNLFPERMYHEYQFIAVDKIERVIIIIAAGPINQDMMEELERVSECKICHYVSTWRDILAAIQRNSKELGGEAQVELTGLGSMLLEAPNFGKSTNGSITQRLSKLDMSKVTSPNLSRPSIPRPTVPMQPKTVHAATLSALLSPLAVSPPTTGFAQIAASTPPSPRLTAFLKVPPPGNSSPQLPAIGNKSSTGLPAIRGASSASWPAVSAMSSAGMPAISGMPSVSGMSSAGMPAVRSSANLSAIIGIPGQTKSPGIGASSAGLPAVKKDKDSPESKDGTLPPKRMSSFLTIRKS